MAAVAEVGSTLLSKCLDFCQALSSQGQAFNFSVAIGPDFTFSLDTRSTAASPGIKKKASPSTLRRNARRREEYLQRKQNPSPVNSTEEVETVADALSCDQCDYKPASEKGLRQHKRMKHKPSQPALTCPASPESLRETVSYSAALVNSRPMSPIAEWQSKPETKCAICKLDLNTHEEFVNHNTIIHKLPSFPY